MILHHFSFREIKEITWTKICWIWHPHQLYTGVVSCKLPYRQGCISECRSISGSYMPNKTLLLKLTHLTVTLLQVTVVSDHIVYHCHTSVDTVCTVFSEYGTIPKPSNALEGCSEFSFTIGCSLQKVIYFIKYLINFCTHIFAACCESGDWFLIRLC